MDLDPFLARIKEPAISIMFLVFCSLVATATLLQLNKILIIRGLLEGGVIIEKVVTGKDEVAETNTHVYILSWHEKTPTQDYDRYERVSFEQFKERKVGDTIRLVKIPKDPKEYLQIGVNQSNVVIFSGCILLLLEITGASYCFLRLIRFFTANVRNRKAN